MTYARLVNEMLNASMDLALIRTRFEGDIYQLNIIPGLEWPVFVISSTEPHTEQESTMTYNLTLYYADREMASDDNKGVPDTLNIHSAGISALSHIIQKTRERLYDEIYEISYPISYTVWSDTEILADKCNGVYCTISVTTPKENVC